MSSISRHGTWGRPARVSADTFEAASPTISTRRTMARLAVRSFSSWLPSRSAASSMASRDASSMCRRRVASSSGNIGHLGFAHDAIAEVAAQPLLRAEIDGAAEDRRQLILHARDGEEPDSGVGLELDENI